MGLFSRLPCLALLWLQVPGWAIAPPEGPVSAGPWGEDGEVPSWFPVQRLFRNCQNANKPAQNTQRIFSWVCLDLHPDCIHCSRERKASHSNQMQRLTRTSSNYEATSNNTLPLTFCEQIFIFPCFFFTIAHFTCCPDFLWFRHFHSHLWQKVICSCFAAGQLKTDPGQQLAPEAVVWTPLI